MLDSHHVQCHLPADQRNFVEISRIRESLDRELEFNYSSANNSRLEKRVKGCAWIRPLGEELILIAVSEISSIIPFWVR